MADVQEELAAALNHKTPKVKLETLRLIQSFVSSSSKQAAAKAHATILPAAAKLAGEAAPDIREAALAVLVAFGMKAGSVSVLDKVGKGLLLSQWQAAAKVYAMMFSGAAKFACKAASAVLTAPGMKAGQWPMFRCMVYFQPEGATGVLSLFCTKSLSLCMQLGSPVQGFDCNCHGHGGYHSSSSALDRETARVC